MLSPATWTARRRSGLWGGYEGAGDLEEPLFGVVLRLPALARGGFLLHQFNRHGVGVQAGGASAGEEPVEVDLVDLGKAVQENTGGPDEAGGDLGAHRHGESQALGEFLFGKPGFFPDKIVPFRFAPIDTAISLLEILIGT
jgi:hypothetical protein